MKPALTKRGDVPGFVPWLAFVVLSFGAAQAFAQPVGVLASRSHSGQFVMVSAAVPRVDPRLTGTPETLQLDPTLLPVSCERIKQHLYREMGAGTLWQAKIFLELHSPTLDRAGIVVASDRYKNAWQYRVSLPVLVDQTLFVRSIVQVLLMEMANRGNADTMPAEVPTWLIEGFTRQILASRQAEVILSSPTPGQSGLGIHRVMKSQHEEPLRAVHATLRTAQPLSFEALSWPTLEHLIGPGSQVYGASAHLFLTRLQQLSKGRERIRAMVELLHARQNWQFAFFAAFTPQFQKTLDVEKWWTLQTVHFTGRELGQWWPLPESCAKLSEALHIPINIHESTNSLPTQGRVTLQTALRQWKPEDQRRLFQQKARELEMLRLRVAPDLVALVEDYRLVLATWLHDNTRGVVLLGVGRKAAQNRAAEHASRRLDILDQRLLEIAAGR